MSTETLLDAWEDLDDATGLLAHSVGQGAAWLDVDARDLAANSAQRRKLRSWIATIEADLAAWDDLKRRARRVLRRELSRLRVVLAAAEGGR